ncbi:hypothetical protein P154DRAFT_575526 [Amniculicola lignicola CBS 123094]|uniref:Uncharacterized protein n=1 Tax=Amniculicola lignicola CBS 123094 TaxID=1392246 RepID=A0A6A5WIQ3_9PLEO|nr:hypothetical protein P154DRAFT_575526 [Amniculicola lignicola CBS 123094]
MNATAKDTNTMGKETNAIVKETNVTTHDIKADDVHPRAQGGQILDQTAGVRLDTAEIFQLTERLRLELPKLDQFPRGSSHRIDHWLESLSAYAHSGYAPSEMPTWDSDIDEKSVPNEDPKSRAQETTKRNVPFYHAVLHDLGLELARPVGFEIPRYQRCFTVSGL